MEGSTICKNCIGLEKCNKYCALQAGTNLVNFINGIDVIETQIGDLRKDSSTNRIGLVVSGHFLEHGENPTYILSDLTTSIDVSGKFLNFCGLTPQQLLKAYLDKLDVSDEFRDNAIKTFRKVNSNKLLPIPLKPGAECEVTYGEDNKTATSKVLGIKWLSNKQTGRLECTIFCPLEKSAFDSSTKIVKIPITDYGDKIRLPQIERTLKSSEIDRDLIKMTSVGFIKPIVVSDGKYEIAIDSQYLYRITDDKVFIIGTWKSDKIVDFNNGIEPIQKSKAYKKIHNGINYIERHRRFIAPYGLFESNKLSVSK